MQNKHFRTLSTSQKGQKHPAPSCCSRRSSQRQRLTDTNNPNIHVPVDYWIWSWRNRSSPRFIRWSAHLQSFLQLCGGLHWVSRICLWQKPCLLEWYCFRRWGALLSLHTFCSSGLILHVLHAVIQIQTEVWPVSLAHREEALGKLTIQDTLSSNRLLYLIHLRFSSLTVLLGCFFVCLIFLFFQAVERGAHSYQIHASQFTINANGRRNRSEDSVQSVDFLDEAAF